MPTILLSIPIATGRNLLQRNNTTDRQLTATLTRSAPPLSIRSAKEVHAFLLRHQHIATCHSLTSLIKLYSHHGLLSQARHLFDQIPDRDVVAWTAILTAHAQCSGGSTDETMHLLHEMLCNGASLNPHTITVLLKQVTLEHGKQIHGYALKRGLDSDKFVGSCLIDFYSKNQILSNAHKVFDAIRGRDVVCFNALISNCSQAAPVDVIISMFVRMSSDRIAPNESTFVALLNACANFGFIGPSKQFHAQSTVRGFDSSEVVQGILIDMYSKCGDLKSAHRAFNQMQPTKSVVAWNSMIGGYGKNGHVDEALHLFSSMRLDSGVLPDHITFTLLLSACSHSGLVREGFELFTDMRQAYRIRARNEHYCCMVDLLGRAGMIRDAYEIIKGSSQQLGSSVWGALLASCRVWGDVEIAELAARRLFETEPKCSGSYVSLAAIFSNDGRWRDAVEVRGLMEGRGVRKESGCSWIEVGGLVHEFRASEGNECEGMEEVYAVCSRLRLSMESCPHGEVLVAWDDCNM